MPDRTLFSYSAPTGQPLPTKGKHYVGGARVDGYYRLTIVSTGMAGAVHILRYDGFGNEVAHTWHESAERAIDSASHDFGIRRDEWQPVY